MSLEQWEAEAEAFHIVTGYLRPGKDDARGIHSEDERRAAWIGWAAGVKLSETHYDEGWEDGYEAGLAEGQESK